MACGVDMPTICCVNSSTATSFCKRSSEPYGKSKAREGVVGAVSSGSGGSQRCRSLFRVSSEGGGGTCRCLLYPARIYSC